MAKLPTGWSLVKLSDLGEVNRGRSRHRPRYAEHLYGGPYPFIQTGDVKASGGRITDYTQTYSEAGLAQSRLWPTGTMCITIAANIAETGILTFPSCFPDSIIGFIADDTKCDVYFVEYTFRYMRQSIQHQASGSVQDNINLQTLERLEFPLPPLPEQRAIADMLGSLDDKIEANRRQNETLEATARAIFKSWFVDFDPVHAKARGEHPPGMDAETAALFPDSFEESELGLIPSGWRVGNLGEIAVNPRRSIQPEEVPIDTFYVGLEHIPQRSLALSEWGFAEDVNSNKYSFDEGEILFGKLRPYFHKVVFAPISGICSTDILVITPNHDFLYGFVIMYLSSVAVIEYATRVSTGTRMPRANWKNLSQYSIVLPSVELLEAFNFTALPIFEQIQNNVYQSRTLAETRDALLPRLVSGELRVGDLGG